MGEKAFVDDIKMIMEDSNIMVCESDWLRVEVESES